MKKVLLSLLAVAALVLSCQNYDDEFDALNAKVSSLESQISSLQGLQTALTSVQSSVSALQSAVNAIPDPSSSIAALSTSIAKILTDLGALETAVAGATTSADLDALKASLNTSLEALKALIEANSASIASLVISNAGLKTQLEALGVDVASVLAANSTFEGNLTITNAAELAYAKSLGAKVSSIKGDVYVKVDQTKADGAGDGTGLTAAQVNEVLSQITFVVGNVKLDTDASLDLSKLSSITGDYVVLGHDVADGALISVGDDVYFDFDGAYTSMIQTADNIYLVIKNDALAVAATGVAAKTGTTSIDFLALTKATGVQSVAFNSSHTSGGSLSLGASADTKTIAVNENATSVKIGQAPVIAVTSGTTAATTALTSVELHYAADATSTNVTGRAALASLTLTGVEISTAVVKAVQIAGAVSIDVQASTATSNTASIDLSAATSITGKLTSDASSNDIAALKTVGGIVLNEQTTFSAPALTTSVGDIDLAEATTFSAPKLARVSAAIASGSTEQVTTPYDITADKVAGAVSLPVLTKAGDVSMLLATSFSAPLAKVEALNIKDGVTTTAPTSIELGSISTYAATIAAGTLSDAGNVTTLTLNAQDVTFNLNTVTEATTITYKGKASSTGAAVVNAEVDTLNEKLVTLNLGGVLKDVIVDTAAELKAAAATTALKTVVTSGTIVSIRVDDNYDLTTLTLGHTDDAKSEGAATIIVNSNHNLSSLTTSVASVKTLTVVNNGKLATMNFSSLTKVPNNFTVNDANKGVVAITITGNYTNGLTSDYTGRGYGTAVLTGSVAIHSKWVGLKGTYSAATNSSDRVYGQSSLATLKPFLVAVKVAHTNASTGVINATNLVAISLDYIASNADATLASAANTDLTGDDAAAYARYADLQ